MVKRLVLAGMLALALAVPASAHAAANSIKLNQLDPHLGGPATFTIVMPSKYGCSAGRCKSHVVLDCSQGGVIVWEARLGSDVAQTTGFVLGADSQWTSGPADCVATLTAVDQSTTLILATTSFTAAG